jgi:predicted dehydrogenase
MVGAGAWSGPQLQAWRGVKGARIVALCDWDERRVRQLARAQGIDAIFSDCAKMLRSLDLDFVDLCVRPDAQPELIALAAAAGLPILCQKPFCPGMHEAFNTDRKRTAAGTFRKSSMR